MTRDFALYSIPHWGSEEQPAGLLHYPCGEGWDVETLSEAYDKAIHHLPHCPAIHHHEEGATAPS